MQEIFSHIFLSPYAAFSSFWLNPHFPHSFFPRPWKTLPLPRKGFSPLRHPFYPVIHGFWQFIPFGGVLGPPRPQTLRQGDDPPGPHFCGTKLAYISNSVPLSLGVRDCQTAPGHQEKAGNLTEGKQAFSCTVLLPFPRICKRIRAGGVPPPCPGPAGVVLCCACVV